MSALIDLIAFAACAVCHKDYDQEQWGRLEFKGHVGHWRAHGTLYAVEMRNCICGGTMGVEVKDPPVHSTTEISDS